MACPESFEVMCERCGKMIPYEETRFLCEMYVCQDCYEALSARIVEVLDEDDGYPD